MAQTQIENLIADGDANAWRLWRQRTPEHAERKVLDGKIGAGLIRRVNPASQLRVVRLVDDGHGRAGPYYLPEAGWREVDSPPTDELVCRAQCLVLSAWCGAWCHVPGAAPDARGTRHAAPHEAPSTKH